MILRGRDAIRPACPPLARAALIVYRQLAESGPATKPSSADVVVSVADVTEVVEVGAVVVVMTAVVVCEVSAACAIPGRASAQTAARATTTGTIQPWIRGRDNEVMAFRSFDEGRVPTSRSVGLHLLVRVGNRAENLRAARPNP
jgi:hypothetical protein